MTESNGESIKKLPPAPDDLGPRSTALWNDLHATYTFRVDERAILFDACHNIDLIDRLAARVEADDLIARGSQGQPVIHPLVPELRQLRSSVASALKMLKLPDSDAKRPPVDTSSNARNAANVRWGNVKP